MANLLPLPPVPITVRAGTCDDIPFIDAMQKANRKALGFFPRAQLEGYIDNAWVLVALDATTGERVGYCASRDRYLKRDELGAVFQMCVVPEARGKLVAANLLREVFERSAYGTKLYCCWCAQDLDANRFWESMGFQAIAFRTGSRSKGAKRKPRVHLFWQKRIRANDTTTPWWYPCQTGGGAIGEDRLVLPIPPGVRWDEEMPVLLPEEESKDRRSTDDSERRVRKPRGADRKSETPAQQVKPSRPTPVHLPSGIRMASPAPTVKTTKTLKGSDKNLVPRRERERVKPARRKHDAALVAKARELRDRYLEQLNEMDGLPPAAKYDMSRRIEGTVSVRPYEPAQFSADVRIGRPSAA